MTSCFGESALDDGFMVAEDVAEILQECDQLSMFEVGDRLRSERAFADAEAQVLAEPDQTEPGSADEPALMDDAELSTQEIQRVDMTNAACSRPMRLSFGRARLTAANIQVVTRWLDTQRVACVSGLCPMNPYVPFAVENLQTYGSCACKRR